MMTTPYRLYTALALAVVGFFAPTAAFCQTPIPQSVRGIVTSHAGLPVAGANVFLLESTDATALSDSAGRFTLRTTATGLVTIVVRRIGFSPGTVAVPVDTTGIVAIVLQPAPTKLQPITVQAGAYTAGNERGMTLTALEVVTTPGAAADVARATQTLPGVQNVDEGTALFVRGGDASETKVLLNNNVMLAPYNYQTPTGNYTVTVDPFLLDGIFFSSGGFGVRYGNILSGVADLRTAGRPVQSTQTATLGLASASAASDLALDHGLTVHATASRNDTQLLFRMNGATRSYSPAPNGNDVSGSVVYDYRPTGQIKTFAIDSHDALGVGVNDPSFAGGYSADVHTSMAQAGWKDVFGTIAPTVSLSYSTVHRNEGFGVFSLEDAERWSQLFTQTAWTPSERVTMRVGGDLDWRDARFIGSIPAFTADRGPGARFTTFDSPAAGGRNGAFADAALRVSQNLLVTPGIRTDYSSFTRIRTSDPRLNAAYQIGDATLIAAVGEYHQVSDPLYFARGIGQPGIGPMSAHQYVVGGQLGEDKQILRLELYDKEYHDLVGLTRDKKVVGGGAGYARGADFFAHQKIWPFATARITYSFVTSHRTDPDSRVLARAPFDVTNSVTAILDQALPKGWSTAFAFRYHTGQPYTPVTGATKDSVRHIFTPLYGPAFSERLPASSRLDWSFSRVTRPAPHLVLVYFFELNNAFDRDNVFSYTYNADYTQRIPVRSLFKRSIYFGASLTHTGT